MTLEEFKNKIETETSIPFCIVSFKNAVPAPFGSILDNAETISSDQKNHGLKHDITVEFYSETAKENIDGFFITNNFAFSKSQTFLNQEDLFITIYNLENLIIEKEGY